MIESPTNWPPPLRAYVTQRLQCGAEDLVEPGVHFVVAHERRLRVWRFTIPVWLMVFDGGGVVSVAPEIAPPVRQALARVDVESLLSDEVMESLAGLVSRWGPTEWFRRALWLYATRDTFTPRRHARVAGVPPSHPEGRALRERHGGEVFGVFHRRQLVSRSSVKIESEVAWEVAVTTCEQFRQRGFGASVVSRATEFILDHGKVALYHCEVANEPSRRLAESLGYRLFARELAWSVDAAWVPQFWRAAQASSAVRDRCDGHGCRPRATVLFVCTHNAARSQMAEAFARRYGAGVVAAYSAGARPGTVHPLTAAVLAERGLNIARQRAKGLDEVPADADVAVTMCDEAAETCPFAQAKRRIHWSLSDPTAAGGTPEQVLAAFRAVRDDIETRVKALVEELRADKK